MLDVTFIPFSIIIILPRMSEGYRLLFRSKK
jgi:hypothetical protein